MEAASTNDNLINSAKNFAVNKFENVGLKNHFLEVFEILKSEFHIVDQNILIAGLLHDTLEDTSTTYEEIETFFGKEVADFVEEVSHPKNYNAEEKKEYYEKIKRISEGGKIIKLADFTSHLRNFIGAFTGENNLQRFTYNEYCIYIRNFLGSCVDSPAKQVVTELNNRLDNYILNLK